MLCGLFVLAPFSIFYFQRIPPATPLPDTPIVNPVPLETIEIVADPEPQVAATAVKPTPVPTPTPTIHPVAEVPEPPKEPDPIHMPILLYHYVRDTVYSRDITRYEMNVTPAVFEDQLKGLIDAGYHFISMAQVSAALDGIGTLPEKPIVLTFDDGIVDVYTNVFPLLKKYQVSITAYLVPSLLDHKQYLTSDMAKTLAQSGLVEIGSHSSHHLKLKALSYEKARSEIADSKTTLEKLLGVSVNTFAYPFGLYGESHPTLVKEAGYTSAASMIWTVVRDSADPLRLPRLNIGERSGAELVKFLKGFK